MIAVLSATADTARGKLPADVGNPIFAYSLNRKLKASHTSAWFQFENANGVFDYPDYPLIGVDKLVQIYDQSGNGLHAVSVSPPEKPTLYTEGGKVRANFTGEEYLDISTGLISSSLTDSFTLLAKGEGNTAPMFSLWGGGKVIVRPSFASVYEVNDKKVIAQNINSEITQLFCGVKPSQNNDRVLEVRTSEDRGYAMANGMDLSGITNACIGKSFDEMYDGWFEELILCGEISLRAVDDMWRGSKGV